MVIWRSEGTGWEKKPLPKFSEAVWRTAWTTTGTALAVTTSDAKITLWTENADGEWQSITAVTRPH